MDKEQEILSYIQENPFITQNDLSARLGLSRSAVAGYISQLLRKGKIVGRAYVLPREAQITCIGAANVDRKAQSILPVQYHESNPAEIVHSSGGVARNIAENLSRLGCTASLITMVGEDNEGKWLLEETRRQGVNVSQAFVLPQSQTGSYTAILDPNGEMVIAVNDMRINDRLTEEMIKSRWPHIASSELVLIDTNVPEHILAYVIDRCKHDQLSLCVNTVSAVKAKKLPRDLNGIQLILPNRNEAEILTDTKIISIADAKEACKQIIGRGVKQVVITLGEQGLVWATEDESEHLLPPKVEVADVTGAGDALMAGVLFGILQGESIHTACRLGIISASLTLQSKGTVSNMNAEQLYSLLTQHKSEELL
jgi:pseudouridine kinase